MRRHISISLVLSLVGVCLATAQQLLTSPIPLSAVVEYQVAAIDAQRDFQPLLDDRPYAIVAKFCTTEPDAAGLVTCRVSPEPDFFTAANATPFPHRLDGQIMVGPQVSQKASAVRILPPLPPAPLACPWVDPRDGVLRPKPVGDDSIWGWNVLPTDPLTKIPTQAGMRATYQRELQLRAWGLAYRIYGTDSGDGKIPQFTDGKFRILIYAPCLGPAQ